jgi:ribosomal protein S18 acetylase RimI-like enzyme
LIDELAERSRAVRVVAETDDDALDFYRRCGFTVADAPAKFGRARHWCVQERHRPAASAVGERAGASAAGGSI